MSEKIVLRKEAADGIIIKEIQFEQVRTQTIIDGTPAYTQTKDIKRLGYKDSKELIDALKVQGYEILR